MSSPVSELLDHASHDKRLAVSCDALEERGDPRAEYRPAVRRFAEDAQEIR